ncbi:hypothetical protein N0B44_33565 [Roseibacterium beibuensis]|uniref:hypothetical protein n=1 Tax=[Roseibacterium] beibuensis TaxID=1193142 RepID=UPI00217DC8A2|nr:hypothetical protein [Roseibacterium beibuensis]MCS6627841.1 hypothetical protein [Roseibacterium beibuensis]
MGLTRDRSLPSDAYAQLRAEVLRAAVELSEDQLLDLTDALHGVIRLRRPGRPLRNPDGWVTDELRSFAG